MIEFPAAWLLYGFLIIGGLLLLLSLTYLLNGLRYGARMTLTVMTSGIYVAGIGLIVWFTWGLLSGVDWSGAFAIPMPSFDFIRFGT